MLIILKKNNKNIIKLSKRKYNGVMYNHTNKEYRILDFEKIAILIYNFSLVCVAMSGFFNIPEVINAIKNFLYTSISGKIVAF